MRQVTRQFFVLVGVSALAACASNGPASPAGSASAIAGTPATAGAPTAAAAATTDANAVPPGYRRVMKGDTEYFCRKEEVTGSRLQKVETCLTRAELADRQSNSQDFINQLQRAPVEPAPPPGSGGAY